MAEKCSSCNGKGLIYSSREIRDRMIYAGHTCVIGIEARGGLLNYGCKQCKLEKKSPDPNSLW